MAKKRKGRSKKKNIPVNSEEPQEIVQAPHSFVIHRGLTCPYIQDLTKDFRRIMEPFTAANLKEKKSNKIKDFVSLCGLFHVSHMCIFNKASTQLSFKVARMPRGPTLTFKVHQFTLARDVIASSRKQFIDEDCYKHAPLVIMNNFSGDGRHLKLMATTFQNMFPTINLATVNLATIRRCVLFSYNPTTKLVDMRHYSIVVVPVGLSRGVKKVVLGKIPNLSRCDDIADFLTKGTLMSDSEYDDDEGNEVVLAQNLKRKGNLENNKSAVRLHEIGPRMTFELVKIEDGLLTGEVLYHETIIKTEEEIEEIRRMREKKRKLKEHRKRIQNENKVKKEQKKLHDKQKSENKDKVKKEEIPADGNEVEPDDDAAYYKEEVGEEPDEELFKTSESNPRKRIRLPRAHMFAKKKKLNEKKKDSSNGDKEEKHFKSNKLTTKGNFKSTTKGNFTSKAKGSFKSKRKFSRK